MLTDMSVTFTFSPGQSLVCRWALLYPNSTLATRSLETGSPSFRVIDESGEDYLFSAERFAVIEVPAAVRASLLKAS